MSECDYGWCRDVRRDEEVRAAEGAANWRRLEVGEVVQAGDEHRKCWGWQPVPTAWYGQVLGDGFWALRRRIPSAPQHRDLPEVVAALTERVARLEAAQAAIGSGDVFRDVGCGSTGDEIVRLTAERDAALRERDEAKEECERLRHLLNTKDRECETHHPLVHPTEAAPPTRGWLTAEERDLIAGLADDDVFTEEGQNIAKALLARETPPKVKMPPASTGETPLVRDLMWGEAIRAAGGEVEG